MALRHKTPDVGKIHRKSALRGIWLEDTRHQDVDKIIEKACFEAHGFKTQSTGRRQNTQKKCASRRMALRHKALDVGKIHRKSALRGTWL